MFHACHVFILPQALHKELWGEEDDFWLVTPFIRTNHARDECAKDECAKDECAKDECAKDVPKAAELGLQSANGLWHLVELVVLR